MLGVTAQAGARGHPHPQWDPPDGPETGTDAHSGFYQWCNFRSTSPGIGIGTRPGNPPVTLTGLTLPSTSSRTISTSSSSPWVRLAKKKPELALER